MSQVIYSTNLEIEGPWILDRTALLELDGILKKIHGQLETQIAQKIENELDDYLKLRSTDDDYEGYKQNRKEYLESFNKLEAYVRFGVSKNKTIVDKSIENILANPEFSDESPISFEAKFELHGDVFKQLQIELNNGYSNRPSLTITLLPSTDQLIREAYSELKAWAQKYEPSLLLKVWAKARFLSWLIWVELVVFTLILYSNFFSADTQFEDRARVLLEGGLSEDEATKALELILRDKYNIYYDGLSPLNFSLGWWELVLLVGFVVCLLVSVKPPLIIGVGQEEKRLKRWKGWIKFGDCK